MEKFKMIDILLVEDNPGDVRLTREVLKDGKINNILNVVMDGEEALDYLHKRGNHGAAQKPDIILLDLNLPKIDGRTLLQSCSAVNFKISNSCGFNSIGCIVSNKPPLK